MKLNNTQEKELLKAIKHEIKKKGYKEKKGRAFFVLKNAFVYSCIDIFHHERLDYDIRIKEYLYDDIFWKIMQMPENSKENISLRAVGAFKSPSIKIKSVGLDIFDEFERVAESVVTDIERSTQDFLMRYSINDYVINLENGMYVETLKCLAYIHRGELLEAKKIAADQINIGNVGDFVNEGKGFFERLLSIDDFYISL